MESGEYGLDPPWRSAAAGVSDVFLKAMMRKLTM